MTAYQQTPAEATPWHRRYHNAWSWCQCARVRDHSDAADLTDADLTAIEITAAEQRGREQVAEWALLLANEFEGLARTSALLADEFHKKGDAVTEEWHRGLAEARRTSADRLRAAVAPVSSGGMVNGEPA